MTLRRREFITLIGGAAAWPLVARAQQRLTPAIGFLAAGSPAGYAPWMGAFHQGLNETGFVAARNVEIEYRWANGQIGRLPGLAADLVRGGVKVLVTPVGTATALAAKEAAGSIPVVFGIAGDPVAAGLVASLNRPGGNVTGVWTLAEDTLAKRLQMLHEATPTASIIGVLLNPTGINRGAIPKELQSAAEDLGLQLQGVYASREDEFDSAFMTLHEARATALMIPPDVLFLDRRGQLGALTLRHAIAAIHTYREFAEAGGLMTYGSVMSESFRQVGAYTGRILKGDKPADLPVQRSTKVELIINLKTANALGLTIPLTLRGLATEVIE